MAENDGTVIENTAPEKIKLGEKEYTQEELQQMVGIAEETRRIETELNTKIDKVYPAFTKTTQEKAELEKELKALRDKAQNPNFDEDSIKQAREAAKKIGIVTEDAFSEFMGKNFRSLYLQERQAEKLLDDCQGLESKHNGEDGLPKFKTEEVLKWMSENGAKNPEQAYKMMYEKEIDDYKSRTLGQAKRGGMVTETGTDAGNKTPPKVPVTRDNIEELMREALGQG